MTDRCSVIDFHSHIIPALDHGCADEDTAKKQLELMGASKTDIVVATPHFYPHIHKVARFCEKMQAKVDLMKGFEISTSPALALGAEVLLCKNLDSMDGLELLCIKGTNVMLLELPTNKLQREHIETVEALIEKGFDVMLAHIDRYIPEYTDGIDTLISLGAKAQINSSALTMSRLRKKLLKYADDESVWAIGSDLHGCEEKAYKSFIKSSKYLKEYYGEIMARSAELIKDAELIKLTKE